MKSSTAQLVTSDPSMEHSRADRTVLFTDMVSYSLCIGSDEVATLEFMVGCFDTIRILAQRHGGSLIKTMGDGALLVFDDAVDAVSFGTEFNRTIAKIQSGEANPYFFRTGVHRGEVLFRNGDVFGNTVNVAARLLAHAEAGGCVVSDRVYSAANALSHLHFEPIGTPNLKNIEERVSLFRVVDPALGSPASAAGSALPILTLVGGPIVPTRFQNAVDNGLDKPALALLGYLALCSGHAESIERLETLLFPGPGNGSKGTGLQAALQQVSDQLALLGITRQGDVISLDQTSFDSDLESGLRDIRQGRVPSVFLQDADWPDHILTGLDGTSPVFRTWLKINRENWRRRVLHELERLVERTTEQDRSYEDAADAILLLEPGNERASLARIEARLFHEDRTAALEEYDRLDKYLNVTYGISVGSRIRNVIKAAVKAVSPQSASSSSEPSRRLLRIAVGAPHGDRDPFRSTVSAFKAELIASLMRFRDWSIIDLTVPSRTKLPEGVEFDYVIDLTVPEGADSSKLELELTEYSSGRVVWAGIYEGEASDDTSFKAAVRNIVVAIKGYVSSDRFAAVYSGIDRFSNNYDEWLRGDRALMRWTPEGAEEAFSIFKQILDRDPDNPAALFRLASVVNIQHIIWPGRHPDKALVRQAAKWAARAVEMDPMDGRIQRTVAWTAAMRREFARATVHMDLAVDLNPNSQATLTSCAMGYAWFGQREKADATLTSLQGIGRNMPEWCWAYNASTLYFLGRLNEAAEAAELGGHSIVDNQGWMAAIQAERGNVSAARQAFDTLFEEVREIWAGPDAATPRTVADWFVKAFPIRHASDVGRLAGAIDKAMQAA